MAEQVKAARPKRERKEPTQTEAQVKKAKTEKLKNDVDSLLSEIDEILNEESVAMTSQFIQAGGE